MPEIAVHLVRKRAQMCCSALRTYITTPAVDCRNNSHDVIMGTMVFLNWFLLNAQLYELAAYPRSSCHY